MREIKYRAWHKKLEEMTKVDSLRKFFVYLLPMSKLSNDSKMFKLEEVEIMQYLGFHDKNGKEVYEGDIVNYEDQTYDIKWNDLYCGFYLFKDDICAKPVKTGVEDIKYVVIGNIFEKGL